MKKTLIDRLWSLSADWEARALRDATAANGEGVEISAIQRAWAQARRNDAAELRRVIREFQMKPRGDDEISHER